jgi:Uma2 family endonuclease
MSTVRRLRTIPSAAVPPLEQGDHLTRDEFERRYDAMPGLKKAELIEGVVFMPSPVRLNHHGRPHIKLSAWLAVYEDATPGVQAGDNCTIRLDPDNEPQPDATLLVLPSHGGQARIDADDYIEGAPELVAEVAASSVSIDLHTKREVYRRNKVREYVVWRVQDGAIDWFALRRGRFVPLAADSAGVVRSEVFPGLWLDVAALLGQDMARVLAVLQQGIASQPHADFVAHLQGGATP